MNGPTPLRVVHSDTGSDLAQPVPHNIEAEQVVLGSVMLAPPTLTEVREHLDATCFYRPAHALIWETITTLADRGDPYHVIPVSAALGLDLTKVGGGPYLHTLIASVPTAAQAGYYAHIVAELAYARQVIETGTRLTQLGHNASTDRSGELRAQVTAQVAAITAADRRGWPDPTPLQATPDLPPFPIWSLPDWLGEYAACLAEATQTPVDLAGCLALAVLAVAAGGKVWADTGRWTEPLCLYTLIVLGPGNRKSEVYAGMTAPIKAAQKTLQEQAKPLIAEAVITRRIAEARADKTARTAADAADPTRQAEALAEAADATLALENATVPPSPRLFGDEPTMEALTSLVREHGGRFALLSPEGEIFSIASGKYSGAASFGILKSGHAGEQVLIDRKGRTPDIIESACLTLGVCTQPGVLARLGATPEFREQGLLGRLLYSVPESLLGKRNPRAEPIPPHTTHLYTTNLTALVLSLNALNDTDSEENHQHPTLTFTPQAQDDICDRLLAETEPRFLPGADLHHMHDWGGKLVGAIIRIAALLHLAKHFRDGWQQPIDTDTLAEATQLGDYFTAHAQAAYDTIGADPAVNAARTILEWIRNTHTAQFKASDLLPGHKHRFQKVADVDPGLRILEANGWIRRLPTPPRSGKGGRPTVTVYQSHPDAHRDPE